MREYDVQKAFFERFVVKIIDEARFGWKMWDWGDNCFVINIRSRNKLTVSFKHITTEFLSDDGEVKQARFIDTWLRDKDMSTCYLKDLDHVLGMC